MDIIQHISRRLSVRTFAIAVRHVDRRLTSLSFTMMSQQTSIRQARILKIRNRTLTKLTMDSQQQIFRTFRVLYTAINIASVNTSMVAKRRNISTKGTTHTSTQTRSPRLQIFTNRNFNLFQRFSNNISTFLVITRLSFKSITSRRITMFSFNFINNRAITNLRHSSSNQTFLRRNISRRQSTRRRHSSQRSPSRQGTRAADLSANLAQNLQPIDNLQLRP